MLVTTSSSPPPKSAVITPYFREPTEKLWRCHNSVKSQSISVDHIMVADGEPNSDVDTWDVQHIKLPIGMADSGDTPRLIGLAVAYALNYEAIMLLDGDNWFEPRHAEEMIATQLNSGASIVTCPRILRRLDESILSVCTESDGDSFNDFNCYLFTHDALAALRPLAFHDRRMAYFTDRFLWHHLRETGALIVRSANPTVNYETTILAHYLDAGETPPPEAKNVVYFGDTGHTEALSADQWAALNQNQAFTVVPGHHKKPSTPEVS